MGRATSLPKLPLQMGLQLQRVRAEDLPQSTGELDAFAVLWQRERFCSGACCWWNAGIRKCQNPSRTLVERIGSLVFIAGREVPALSRATLRFTVNKPEAAEQKRLWQQALGPAARID